MSSERFIDLIIDAIDLVKQEYYMVTTTYRPLGIVRERVFCYELYHQLRCLQDSYDMMEVQIHGEIDKRGHELFAQDEQKNPDFIFHVPGIMKSNSVVIEVKGNIEGSYREKVLKDIQTLLKFTEPHLQYKLGILIIYNYSMSTFKGEMSKYLINNNIGTIGDNILIICKESENVPTEQEMIMNILK